MKEMIIEIADIDGMSFGAALYSPEDFNESLEDGILEDTPFELTSSIVKGPFYWGDNLYQSVHCNFDNDDDYDSPGEVYEVKAFNSNKEIDESEFFTKEQAEFVKKNLKWSANEYYSTWRSGQRAKEEKLLEVEEHGSGSMTAKMKIEGDFDTDNLFFILADTLPGKTTVIAAAGYINPDGSITGGSFEYAYYTWDNPSVKYDGEEIC